MALRGPQACREAENICRGTHSVHRMKGHYVNIWALSGRGIFKVTSACHIEPARRQRHSFKSSTQEPYHNFLAPEGRLRTGPQPGVPCVSFSCPFSFAAHGTGWFCDGLQCQLSELGRHDPFSLPWLGKAFLEDTQKATIVTNGAWQA